MSDHPDRSGHGGVIPWHLDKREDCAWCREETANDEIARLKAENESLKRDLARHRAQPSDDDEWMHVDEVSTLADRAEQAESDLRACAPIVKTAQMAFYHQQLVTRRTDACSNPEYEAPERPCRQDPDDEPAEWCVGCRLAESLASLPEDTKARMGLTQRG